MNITKVIAAIASSAVLLFTGVAACASEPSARDRAKAAGMTDSQVLACEDLQVNHAHIAPANQPGRIDMARMVNRWAQPSGEPLRSLGDKLAIVAPVGPAAAWNQAVDEFAGQCISLGWPTK